MLNFISCCIILKLWNVDIRCIGWKYVYVFFKYNLMWLFEKKLSKFKDLL